MKDLIFYLIMFVIVYLFYIIFVLRRKNVLNKFLEGKEIKYLKYRYKIKVNEKNKDKIIKSIFLANSFIISTTLYVVGLIDNFILVILLGFMIMIILILGVYHLVGMYCKKQQGGEKNV